MGWDATNKEIVPIVALPRFYFVNSTLDDYYEERLHGIERQLPEREYNMLQSSYRVLLIRGRLHGAFSMCVFMSDKPFVAEACQPMSHAAASNGLSDMVRQL
jgi:hypothetical protein